MKFTWTLVFLFLYFGAYAQNINGFITDQESGDKLQYVNVIMLKDSTLYKGTTSDENGYFILSSLKQGNYYLQCSFIGYKTHQSKISIGNDIPLDQILITLEKTTVQSSEAVIFSRSLREPQSTLISKEFFMRIPGAFNDPARLAFKFPGISSSDDQNNEIVVRGLAPHLSSWAINGANVVNPNHLSNAGTITDLSSSSGGGTNMISGNSIKEYQFLSNPIDEKYYNVAAGISNTSLEIPTGLSASLGLLGTEISYAHEGKIDVGINYRYSTLGILSAVGIPLGDEKIHFQDLHIRLAKKWKKHGLEFNSIAGDNENFHESIGETSKNIRQATTVDFRSQQFINSLIHTYSNHKIISKTAINYSMRRGDRWSIVSPTFGNLIQNDKQNYYNESLLSFSNTNRYYYSTTATFFSTVIIDSGTSIQTDMGNNRSAYSTNFIALVGMKNKWNNLSSSNSVGISSMSLNRNLELRSSTVYTLGRNKIALQYSRQATAIINEIRTIKQSIAPIVSNNLALNYYINNEKLYFQIGAFYSHYKHVPVSKNNTVSYFDNITLIKKSFQEGAITNTGEANQYGLQTQIEYLLLNKIQFISGFSIYDLKVRENNREFNSSYNFNFTHANTISYALKIKSNKLIFGVSAIGRGAGYEQAIDVDASTIDQETVFDFNKNKTRVFAPYFRVDTKLDYIYGKTNKNRLSLDIQNVTNRQNDAYLYFDPLLNEITLRNQLGLIPILKYTRKFI